MKKINIICLLIAGLVIGGCNIQTDDQLPNFVVIFIDDMGYGEIEPFGSTVNKTPSLTEMANEGMIFTDFYVSWTACTPSRATLLTGCYARRVGMDGKVCFPVDRKGLNPEEETIAEVLKTRGYATGCFGKWHLGDQPQFLPTKQGFDEYVGIPYSNDMYRGTYPWADQERVVNYIENLMSDGAKLPHLPFIKDDEVVAYIPDGNNQALMHGAVTDAAVDFIKRHKNEPFFVYVPYPAIHGPIFVSGMENSEYEKVYSAHIGEVDASVGKILNTLKEIGIDKNTFVLFTSDNGGSRKYASHGPLRGYKGYEPYEGRMREPTIAWWPGKIPAGQTSREIIASIDILPTLVSLAGAQIPANRIIDGHDVSDLFLGKPGARSPHDILYHQTDAIRMGNWKLVDYFDRTEKINRVELYDLNVDIGEKNDLSAQYPEKVKELQKLLEKHAEELDKNIRPAAFVDDPVPLVTLEECENLPTLEEYLNKEASQDIQAKAEGPWEYISQAELYSMGIENHDATMPFIRLGEDDYWIYLSEGGKTDGKHSHIIRARTSISGVDMGSVEDVPVYGIPDAGINEFNGWKAWMMNLHEIDEDEWLAVLHYEDQDAGSKEAFRMGIAYSDDDGQSFEHLGFILNTTLPDSIIKQGNCAAMINIAGNGIRADEKYLYVYFSDMNTEDRSDRHYAVARADKKEVVKNARKGINSNWYKYFQGEWNEPGMGGQSSSLGRGSYHTTLMYNTYIKQWIMCTFHGGHIGLSISEDPLDFHGDPVLLYKIPEGHRVAYTSIHPDQADMTTCGKEFNIYYRIWHKEGGSTIYDTHRLKVGL